MSLNGANKAVLSDRIARELNVNRRTAERVLDAVLDSVRDLLRTKSRVAVNGFGAFEVRTRKGRDYKHPLTGQSIAVADKETIVFMPSHQLIADTRKGSTPRRPTRPQTDSEQLPVNGDWARP